MSRAAAARFTFRAPFNCLTRPAPCFFFSFFLSSSKCLREGSGGRAKGLFFFFCDQGYLAKSGEAAVTASIYPGCHKLVMELCCKIALAPADGATKLTIS